MRRILLLTIPFLLAATSHIKAEDKVNTEVEKVYVVFKTHLDVGFTDWSSVVIDRYINEFIPKALDLSERLAEEGRSGISPYRRESRVSGTGSAGILQMEGRGRKRDSSGLSA